MIFWQLSRDRSVSTSRVEIEASAYRLPHPRHEDLFDLVRQGRGSHNDGGQSRAGHDAGMSPEM
jgi:hypothetical protein